MKRVFLSVCALACCGVATGVCVAQANAWNGDWKADPASMKYEGATMMMASQADGYTITMDGKANPKVICDGQPHETATAGQMRSCTKTADGYELTYMRDGKTVSKGGLMVSADGKMATRKMEYYPDGEPAYTMTMRMKRVGAGKGADGTWKEVGFGETQDTGILSIAVHDGNVDFKETDSPKPVTCKLDGTETKIGDRSMSVKQVDAHTLKVTYRGADGKVQRENTFTVSADGKTMHEMDETPAPGPTKMWLTLHKA